MQSLKSIGTDIPVRLAVDRVSLYVAEIMPMINEYRAEVLDVQTQYTDGLEDFVKAVFVRGIEDAIAARDAWHLDKVCVSPCLVCLVTACLWLDTSGTLSHTVSNCHRAVTNAVTELFAESHQ
jgi:hypothetical protein